MMRSREWPGQAKPGALIATVLRDLRAQPLHAVACALVVAAVCVVVFTTTGQSAASEQAVLSRIDSVGTRTIVLSDGSEKAMMSAESVEAVTRLSTVESAFGLGTAHDGRNANAPVTGTIAIRPYVGELPADIALVDGRLPNHGEALVGERAARKLGLVDGVGGVEGQNGQWPMVGVFAASGALDSLNDIVIFTPTDPDRTELRYLYVVATHVNEVEQLAALLPGVVVARDPGKLTVEPPTAAIQLREVISGDLGRSSRALMLAVLGAGLLMIAITTHVAVAARRTTFGRRRALGASRSTIVAMVLWGTSVQAAAGAVVGAMGGVIAMSLVTEDLPAWSFLVAVPLLAILMSLFGAVAPALIAARRDPLLVLRVP
ncbi:FtsX-like permease family protein [Demequina sediminicola]|uniref:FtsX-like permease family protein n=1 Tax=Demequina sediminicola TaxID=1095026 RepID=UPI000785685B|nr:ABC transporter permease [Demequina sediminicola]